MTRAVGDDAAMVKSLTDVVGLFELAQVSVFKLMSSVCVLGVSSGRPESFFFTNIFY